MYITPSEAQQRYGYNPKTLSRWADDGKIQSIKSPGGHRRYLVESLEKVVTAIDDRPIILYARVSTASQKDDHTRAKLNILARIILIVNVSVIMVQG